MRSNSQAGPPIDLFGQARAPVLRSRAGRERRNREFAIIAQRKLLSRILCGREHSFVGSAEQIRNETNDIYGRSSIDLSMNATLQSCLESKLRDRMARYGLPGFKRRWLKVDSLLPPKYSRLVLSGQRTKENGSTGLLFEVPFFEKPVKLLTPVASDVQDSGKGNLYYRKHKLVHQLSGLIEPKSGKTFMALSFVVNPDLIRWLMGYPETWTLSAPLEMLSYRKQRKSSSKRLKKPSSNSKAPGKTASRSKRK